MLRSPTVHRGGGKFRWEKMSRRFFSAASSQIRLHRSEGSTTQFPRGMLPACRSSGRRRSKNCRTVPTAQEAIMSAALAPHRPTNFTSPSRSSHPRQLQFRSSQARCISHSSPAAPTPSASKIHRNSPLARPFPGKTLTMRKAALQPWRRPASIVIPALQSPHPMQRRRRDIPIRSPVGHLSALATGLVRCRPVRGGSRCG